jgi:hypothetical protein
MLDAVLIFSFADQCSVFQVGFKNGKDSTNRNKTIKKTLLHKNIEKRMKAK